GGGVGMDDTLLNLDETPTAPDRKQGSAIARFFLVRPTTLVSVASVLGLVGIWAVLSLGHVVSNRFLASPLEVAREIGVLFKEGYINVPFHVHLGYSITRSLAGLVAAIPVGIPLGLLIGYNRIVSAVLLPPFAICR